VATLINELINNQKKYMWLKVIIIVALIGGVIGFLSSGKKEDAAAGAVGAGLGCGYLMLQIFLGALGLWVMLKLASWLFS
jgi:hypothetical protein